MTEYDVHITVPDLSIDETVTTLDLPVIAGISHTTIMTYIVNKINVDFEKIPGLSLLEDILQGLGLIS